MNANPDYYAMVKQNQLVPINLIHLYGAFVLLDCGYYRVSLMVFIGKQLFELRQTKRSRSRGERSPLIRLFTVAVLLLDRLHKS